MNRDNDLTTHLEKEWFDGSKLGLFQRCPARYWARYEQHLVPEDFDAPDLEYGAAIHKGLECLYVGNAEERVPYNTLPEGVTPPPDGCIKRIFAEFLDHFPKHLEHRDKTRLSGLDILSKYQRKWQNEPFDVLAVEEPFAIDMGDWYYVGKIDLVYRAHSDQIARPMDHKTTSRFGDVFTGGFKFNRSMTGYIHLVREKFDNRCNEACINALRVTSRIDVTESFQRFYTSRTPFELDGWEPEVQQLVKWIRECRSSGTWPKHGHDCHAYMRQCEYFDICMKGPLRDTYNGFRKEQWQPV